MRLFLIGTNLDVYRGLPVVSIFVSFKIFLSKIVLKNNCFFRFLVWKMSDVWMLETAKPNERNSNGESPNSLKGTKINHKIYTRILKQQALRIGLLYLSRLAELLNEQIITQIVSDLKLSFSFTPKFVTWSNYKLLINASLTRKSRPHLVHSHDLCLLVTPERLCFIKLWILIWIWDLYSKLILKRILQF